MNSIRTLSTIRPLVALACAATTWWSLQSLGCSGSDGMPTPNMPADAEPDPGPPLDSTVSFSRQIQPILDENCAVCHSNGGFADVQGIDLKLTADVAYEMLINQQSVLDSSLTFVIPSDADDSLMFQVISSGNPPVAVRMPFGGPALPQDDIELIRRWINQGALDN